MTDAPIFVLGANRSGTTLLRLMLNAHPRISIPEELTYFYSTYGKVPLLPWRSPAVSPSWYESFVRERAAHAHTLHPELDPDDLTSRIVSAGSPNFRRPYRMILEEWARLHGKPRWGEKTPGNVFFVDVIYDMFPNAQFVHVVRDPRAGVASMLKVPFFSNDVTFNALIRRKYASFCSHFQQLVPSDQWMTIRYENLVLDPESTLRSVFSFLGEEYDSRSLNYHLNADQFMKKDAASSFNARATRPISTASLKKWRTQLSVQDVALVETVCRDEMARFGYARWGNALTWTRWAALYVKWGYWRLQQWRNRKDREHLVRYPMFARFLSRTRRALRTSRWRVLRRLTDTG